MTGKILKVIEESSEINRKIADLAREMDILSTQGDTRRKSELRQRVQLLERERGDLQRKLEALSREREELERLITQKTKEFEDTHYKTDVDKAIKDFFGAPGQAWRFQRVRFPFRQGEEPPHRESSLGLMEVTR